MTSWHHHVNKPAAYIRVTIRVPSQCQVAGWMALRLTNSHETRNCHAFIFTETCLHHILNQAVALNKRAMFSAELQLQQNKERCTLFVHHWWLLTTSKLWIQTDVKMSTILSSSSGCCLNSGWHKFKNCISCIIKCINNVFFSAVGLLLGGFQRAP